MLGGSDVSGVADLTIDEVSESMLAIASSLLLLLLLLLLALLLMMSSMMEEGQRRSCFSFGVSLG